MTDETTFPAQQQEPPGLTGRMEPVPDHGEQSYRGTGRLEGRRALITGGDSGIGRAVAIAFAREGADVAIGYLPQEQEDAEETARWVREAGRTCALLPGDVTDEATARALPGRAASELGGLDVLVNNAGFQMARRESIEDVTTDEIDRVLKTNLYALLWITQSALEHLGEGAA
ncbi:MAG: SDR family NAD(P)-dependent oxidoreductase, partial [Cellulosimicrobium funkei]